MAKITILKLITILSLLVLLITLQFQIVSSIDDEDIDIGTENEDEEYVVDTPLLQLGPRTRSRFLARIIKKGMHCDRVTNNICNGIQSTKGTGLLFCCKKHCRNVLSDKNNCGRCEHKCQQGEKCCGGICTKVLSNVHHCGKCDRKCSPGDSCGNGFCGYA